MNCGSTRESILMLEVSPLRCHSVNLAGGEKYYAKVNDLRDSGIRISTLIWCSVLHDPKHVKWLKYKWGCYSVFLIWPNDEGHQKHPEVLY